MPRQLFANNAVTLLALPISPIATELQVMPGYGSLFPQPVLPGDYFLVTLEDQAATTREIIAVTGRTGDVFTGVVRGQEGTLPQSWGASSGNDTLVDHRVTAETMRRAMELPALAISDLTDVSVVAPAVGDVLSWDGTQWISASAGMATNPVIPGTEAMRLPTGTTAQRPGAPLAGVTRFNSTTSTQETYTGTYWSPAGRVLQVVTGPINATTTTAQVPFGNTVPTNTEGVQVWAQAFTPLSATSRILVQFSITVAQNTVAQVITASVFAGATNIGASSQLVAPVATTQNLPFPLSYQVVFQPGSTSPITFTCRVGANGTGTTSINTTPSGTLGGALVSHYTIMEIEA
jgi:hypothetical protein